MRAITAGLSVLIAALVIFFITMAIHVAWSHEHQAGETDEQRRVIEFYRTWLRPKGNFAITHRNGSCCYSSGEYQDCFAVKESYRDKQGVLWVKPDTDGVSTLAQASYGDKWYGVTTGVDEDKQPDPRESPDGRSHVCIAGNNVICYVGGWGN